MALKMTTAQVVETSVTVTNSSFQNYTHPDDHTTRTTDTPGFKPFTKTEQKGLDVPLLVIPTHNNFKLTIPLSLNCAVPKPTLEVFFQTNCVNLSVAGVSDRNFQLNLLRSPYHRLVARAPVRGEPYVTIE